MGSPPCTMKLLIITLLAAAVSAAPDLSQMTCEECTAEMHKLGGVVKGASPYIENYLINNYCPTLPEDDHACDYDLSMHYTEMLYRYRALFRGRRHSYLPGVGDVPRH